MARGWRYTKLSLSSFLLLYFFWHVVCVIILFFVLVSMLSFGLCRCSSDFFLSSRPHTGLATTFITGYG